VRALQDNGLMETYFADCPFRQQTAFEATTYLLNEHPHLTAVFGCNDGVTLGAMQAAQAMSRRVPEEFSVIGFDDVDFARRVRPALTTMHVDKAEMGRMAVQLLINRLKFPDTARTTLVIQPTLVERESVARPPSA
jgi:LacI family transcriptional regulator